MEIIKISLDWILADVYKAKDCTDINDCDIAIEKCIQLRRMYGHYYASITKRLISLQKRKERLLK